MSLMNRFTNFVRGYMSDCHTSSSSGCHNSSGGSSGGHCEVTPKSCHRSSKDSLANCHTPSSHGHC